MRTNCNFPGPFDTKASNKLEASVTRLVSKTMQSSSTALVHCNDVRLKGLAEPSLRVLRSWLGSRMMGLHGVPRNRLSNPGTSGSWTMRIGSPSSSVRTQLFRLGRWNFSHLMSWIAAQASLRFWGLLKSPRLTRMVISR